MSAATTDRDDGPDRADGPGRDEVDDIVAAWEAELPEADVAPLQVMSRIARLSRRLDRARRGALATHELAAWEFDVLAALRRAGGDFELRPSDLVEQTLSTSGTMTNRLVRLERRGLVTRHKDPRDGRGTRVRLTSAGRHVVDQTLTALLARERHLLAALPPQEQEQLAELLRHLLVSLDGPDERG